ncbi:MAG: aldose epimerase family protein [Acidobacteriaceae bacterium]
MLTLLDKETTRNLLWQNPRVRPQRFPVDANFDNYWCGGWDDAFPTADPCDYGGESFPNLGELRSLEWNVDAAESNENSAQLTLSVFAPISPVRATKTITLTGDTLSMRFQLQSLGPLPVDFLWGTHPAFNVGAGTRFRIPARTGIVSFASDPSLGKPCEEYAWPMLNGVDMSRAQGIEAGISCGHYATDLEDGWFAVEDDTQGIVFRFPLEQCPHLWLWLVYGGWRGYHHAIIEPWTSYPVNLAAAVKQGRNRRLAAGETFDVTVRCTPYSGAAKLDEALQRLHKS